MPRVIPFLALTLAFALTACGGDDKKPPAPSGTGGVPSEHPDETAMDHDHDHEGAHGGHVLELGEHAAHAEIVLDHDAKSLVVWLSDSDLEPIAADQPVRLNLVHDGKPLQLEGKPGSGKDSWLFQHDAFAGEPEGRLRIVIGGVTYNPELDAGHDHDHDHGDHDHDGHDHHHGPAGEGVKAALTNASGTAAGHIELKLHDDAGDLELWVTKDADGHEPLDLPLDTVITVAIGSGADAKTVNLRVRDTDQNANEEGESTVRDGRTNYFIFPGETGADASWLKGSGFSAPAVVTVPAEGGPLIAKLTLVPHKH